MWRSPRSICYSNPVRRRAWGWLGAGAILVGCAGSPPPTVERLYVDGVRQRPLTEEEAERLLRKNAPMYETCYRREMMNLTQNLSDYIFRVWIPTDGTGADVEMVKASIEGQVTLQECLEEALARVRFPAHTGEPIALHVPLKGPA